MPEKKFTDAAKRLQRIGIAPGVMFTAMVRDFDRGGSFKMRPYQFECTAEIESSNKGMGFWTLEFIATSCGAGRTKSIRMTASQIDHTTVIGAQSFMAQATSVAKSVEGLKNQYEHAQAALERAQKNLNEIGARINWCANNGVTEAYNEKVYLASALIDGIKGNGSTMDVATKLVAALEAMS